MTANTVGLKHTVKPPAEVFVVRNRLQMVWVDATSVPTQMIEDQVIGKRTMNKLVNDAVSSTFSLPAGIVKNGDAVAELVDVTRPVPAVGCGPNTGGEMANDGTSHNPMFCHATNLWWNAMAVNS